MSVNRTLQQLLASVRYVGDTQRAVLRHTDEDIVGLMNKSRLALRVLMSDHGDSWYLERANMNAPTAGDTTLDISTDIGAVPLNIIHVYGVDMQVNGEWREVVPFQLAERNKYESEYDGTGIPTAFRRRSATLLDIIPATDAAYAWRIWYLGPGTAFAAVFDGNGALSSSSSTFDGIASSEDWLIYDTAVRVATRDAGSADNLPDLKSELARIESRVLSAARKGQRVSALRRLDTRGRRRALERSSRAPWVRS